MPKKKTKLIPLTLNGETSIEMETKNGYKRLGNYALDGKDVSVFVQDGQLCAQFDLIKPYKGDSTCTALEFYAFEGTPEDFAASGAAEYFDLENFEFGFKHNLTDYQHDFGKFEVDGKTYTVYASYDED